MDTTALCRLFEVGIPFHAWLGLRAEVPEAGRSRLVVPYRPELVGDASRPALHGGVVGAIADAAAGLAVYSSLGVRDRTSTIDLRVDYLAPALPGAELVAEGSLVRMGDRVAVADVVLHQGRLDAPVAVARGAYRVARGR